jgi:hypothetical protein
VKTFQVIYIGRVRIGTQQTVIHIKTHTPETKKKTFGLLRLSALMNLITGKVPQTITNETFMKMKSYFKTSKNPVKGLFLGINIYLMLC